MFKAIKSVFKATSKVVEKGSNTTLELLDGVELSAKAGNAILEDKLIVVVNKSHQRAKNKLSKMGVTEDSFVNIRDKKKPSYF